MPPLAPPNFPVTSFYGRDNDPEFWRKLLPPSPAQWLATPQDLQNAPIPQSAMDVPNVGGSPVTAGEWAFPPYAVYKHGIRPLMEMASELLPSTQADSLPALPDTRGLVPKPPPTAGTPAPAPLMHRPEPGQTSFTNADLNWEHQNGPVGLGAGFGSAFGQTYHGAGGGSGTFEPGPGSDYYEEEQIRKARDAALAAGTARSAYEQRMISPVTPGQAPIPEIGMEAQQRQQRAAADAALDAKMVEIYGTGGYGQGGSLEAALARHDADFPGANHHSDPTGQRIRDSNARAAYIQGIAAIKEAADRAFSLAKLRYESQTGGRAFEAAFQGATGRAAAKDISEGGYGLR